MEAFALLRQRCGRALDHPSESASSTEARTQNSSPPRLYARPEPATGRTEPAGTREDGIAGGVAERVVVGLEAVEVEDDERGRIGDAASAPRGRRGTCGGCRAVSASVSASSRLASSSRTRSRNVSTARTITMPIAADARAMATALMRW